MSSSSLAAEQARRPARVNDTRLVVHQLRYDLLGVWRDPQSRFFTIVLPLIFLVLLTSLFGNHTLHVRGDAIKDATYYVPGIATMAIIATSFVNLVITITGQRESGVLKRRRSSPVPAWVLIASRALTSAILASAIVAVIVATGRIAYGVQLPSSALPAFVLGVTVGSAAFCCLSFASASFIRNEDSAQPLIQAIILPLYFISGVLVPKDQLPSSLRDIASVFPVSHLVMRINLYGPRTGSPAGQPFQAQAVVGPPGWMAAGTWMTPTNDALQLFGEQQQWVYQPFGGAAPQRGPYQVAVSFSSVAPDQLAGIDSYGQRVSWRRL